jgi:V/A-type H+-transporting ATPase subunit I
MSVEHMKLLNLVGPIGKCDEVFKRLVMTGMVHPISTIKEIELQRFYTREAMVYVEEMKTCHFGKYPLPITSYKATYEKLMKLMGLLDMEPELNREYLSSSGFNPYLTDNIQILFDRFEDMSTRIESLTAEYDLLVNSSIVESFADVNIDLNKVFHLEHFTTHFGTLAREFRDKLAFNYENISATVLHLSDYGNEMVYLIIAPQSMETETDRILRSVHFKEIPLATQYFDYPQVMLHKINVRMAEISIDLSGLKDELNSFKSKFETSLTEAYSDLSLEQNIAVIRNQAAYSKSFFYFAGWVPDSAVDSVARALNDMQAEILVFYREKEDIDISFIPPTRLRNSWFTKPFEMMVKMYGVPNYSEVDPTALFGWTYMLLFGAMFGDLGQGLIFVLAGYLFSLKKKMMVYGQLMIRLGMSSMIFGFWYDSAFGYEHLISGLLFGKTSEISRGNSIFLRPIDNISTILTLSIGLGVLLLLISYGLSVVNKLKVKDYQEGYFGRNGIAGMVLYVCLLGVVLDRFNIIDNAFVSLLLAVSGICIVLIIVKEPLVNALTNQRPLYHETKSEYYIESGFDIVETFLSMLSNSVSFIRVGAFALNHVGLFIAFHTIGDMLGSTTASIVTVIIGNIIVIGLEGLIVFIQGLRLMYYEMFSKYYSGDGFEYAPVSLDKETL